MTYGVDDNMENTNEKSIFLINLNWIDYLTLSGVALASCSVGFAFAGKLSFAMSFMFLAMLADAFDGFFARKFNKESDFGRYLDSFIDVLDYLIAPSLFLYLWGFSDWYYIPVLIIFVACGIIRLSVFNEIGNVEDDNKSLSYLGMPVFWSVLILGILYTFSWLISKQYLFPVIAIILAAFSLLMVYKRPFYKFKNWIFMLVVILGSSIIFALDGFGIL